MKYQKEHDAHVAEVHAAVDAESHPHDRVIAGATKVIDKGLEILRAPIPAAEKVDILTEALTALRGGSLKTFVGRAVPKA